MRRAATKKAPPIEQGTSEWSQRRLLGILAAAVAVAVLLLGGLAYAVYLAIAGIGDETSANTGETVRSTVALGAAHRDEIAAAEHDEHGTVEPLERGGHARLEGHRARLAIRLDRRGERARARPAEVGAVD